MFIGGSQQNLDLLKLPTKCRCSHPRRVVSRTGTQPAEPRDAHVFGCSVLPRIRALARVIEEEPCRCCLAHRPREGAPCAVPQRMEHAPSFLLPRCPCVHPQVEAEPNNNGQTSRRRQSKCLFMYKQHVCLKILYDLRDIRSYRYPQAKCDESHHVFVVARHCRDVHLCCMKWPRHCHKIVIAVARLTPPFCVYVYFLRPKISVILSRRRVKQF